MSCSSDVAGPGAEDGTGLWRGCLPGVQLTELSPLGRDLLIFPAKRLTVGQVRSQHDLPPPCEVILYRDVRCEI